MRCKLDSTENARAFEKYPTQPSGEVGYFSYHVSKKLQKDFRKDPQVEPKFCRSFLTSKFVDAALIRVMTNIWNPF